MADFKYLMDQVGGVRKVLQITQKGDHTIAAAIVVLTAELSDIKDVLNIIKEILRK